MAFCGGRTDATETSGRSHLKPIIYDSRLSAVVKVKDAMSVKGLTARQGVALAGKPSGSDDLDNDFFFNLMMAHDDGNQGMFGDEEWALVQDAELRAIMKLYAESKGDFLKEFTSAWAYLMTADRFDGPRANACKSAYQTGRNSMRWTG